MVKKFTLVFGLTADPIHKGHAQVIINSINYLCNQNKKIKRVIIIPVYSPNLIANKNKPVATFKQRYQMCCLVAKQLSRQLQCPIKVSKIEKKLAKKNHQPNYSYNTLKALQLKNPLFLVSADHFQGQKPKFSQWYKWQELIKISGLLINQRADTKINLMFIAQLKQQNKAVYLVEAKKTIAISSTQIRENIKDKSIQKYLNKDVANYIAQHGVY